MAEFDQVKSLKEKLGYSERMADKEHAKSFISLTKVGINLAEVAIGATLAKRALNSRRHALALAGGVLAATKVGAAAAHLISGIERKHYANDLDVSVVGTKHQLEELAVQQNGSAV